MPSKSQTRTIQNFAQNIVDTVREPLIILDASLRVTSANRAFYQMFHMGRQATEGRLIYELGEGQWDVPALRTLLESIIVEHAVFNDFELEQDFPVLGHRIMLLNARSLRADVHTEMLLLAMEDVTDRRKAEGALEKALDIAEAASNTKSAFLAGMSHELRTPLNAILGYSEMLQEEAAEKGLEKMAADLQRIHGAGTQLLGLINDMLDLSKIEAGKMTFEPVDFNLRDAMEEIAELLAHRAQEKGLELLCFLPPGFPVRLRGDEGRIRQIITNLLANAIKFTEHGQAALEAEVLRETARSVLVRLTVHDTGIGIPRERHTAIFESFTQADPGITQRFGGTGLGLTISRQLAELMGGRVGLDSEPGQGSRFWVELLLKKQAGPSGPGLASPAALNGHRVLVMDANAANRRLLCDQLTAWGCRPTDVETGSRALELLTDAVEQSDPFQTALLARNMPILSGIQLEQAIRSDTRFDTLSLILMSGVVDRDAEYLHARSFASFLTKPVRQRALLAAMLRSAGAPETSLEPVETGAHSQADLDGLRVLLAEDNQVNTLLARHWLRRWNCEIDAVEDGLQVVQAARDRVYDVILMDVEMPGIDGFEATRQIRQAETSTGRHIPIIAMTAHNSAGDRSRCIQHGMDDYVSKPIRPLLLREALERWQGNRTVRPNARSRQASAPHAGDAPASVPTESPAELPEGPLFDLNGLLDRCDQDAAFAHTVLQEFLRTAPAKLQEFLGMLESGDMAAIHRGAHTLKGTLSMVGGVRLGNLYQEVESRTEQGGLNGIVTLLPEILKEHALLIAEIRNCLAGRRTVSHTK